tara:strand:- start:405 stop:725 length:321 start_codon:yes stop_codon:yes gene_type:complete
MPIYHNEDHRLHFPQAELSVGEIIAANVPVRGMHMGKTRTDIDGKVGYYCHASETAMTQGRGLLRLAQSLARKPRSVMSRQERTALSPYVARQATMPRQISTAATA